LCNYDHIGFPVPGKATVVEVVDAFACEPMEALGALRVGLDQPTDNLFGCHIREVGDCGFLRSRAGLPECSDWQARAACEAKVNAETKNCRRYLIGLDKKRH